MPPETVVEGGLSVLDHLVVGIYLVAMLWMGVSFARKQHSTEDFFVGGRTLPAWAVGISIFASLLSTITYLGMPGEMFRSGIAFLTRQIPIPLVLLVVWLVWIPFFMRLDLTSAYEYLERRFNYATRALAAIFCLLLLFGWIAVVVLTASKAMAEITDLNVGWFFGNNLPATAVQPDGSARINAEDLTGNVDDLVREIGSSDSATTPTPAKRIWELFDETTRQQWRQLPADGPLDESTKSQIADALTFAVSQPNLYSQEHWETVSFNKTARTYLSANLTELTDSERSHLNRALLESAFPDRIASSHPQYRDADMHLIIIAIGLFSVLYTTLGGMRAVVWTDVIQFFVLIGGALFTMGAIAWMTDSGISDWIRVSQQYKHEQVEWYSFDVGDRSNVLFIATSMFFWYICTHGANQVALQRYFSVGTVRAARRSYLISALAAIGIGIILAGVGIALMYFIQYSTLPDLPAESGIRSVVDSVRNESTDKVFPQFIRMYLPSGLRGMVIAALFAAAMSTIDSGANSVSTILTIDFFRRLDPEPATAERELKRARILTACMGLIVVASTLLLYHMAKGTDIISLCQKGFNCFLGPLGALFVLAMFSRRATALSVIPAVLIGEAVGIGTSYSEELFDFSFSTHLVVAASWLATLVAAQILSLILNTRATEAQQKWMWIPIVRGESRKELPE